MKNVTNYNIGLDIGVGSVGWCVTDENSTILKKGKRNLWGSRIFEEASTAKQTREFRGSRRRLERRKARINILQSIILDDIEQEYPNFLQMLRESSLNANDKITSASILGTKHNLFSDNKMTDITYYKNFKTIYHLRNYLVNTTDKVDIRLVYLAIHHIIKYRGNFLYDGDFSQDTNEVENKFRTILDYLNEIYGIELKTNSNEIFEILSKKNTSKANKKDEIISCFDFDKQDKQIVVNIVNSFLGYKFDLTKIFEDFSIEKSSITFSTEIENEETIINSLQDNSEIYQCMKDIYSWYILQDILNGKIFISEAFIEKYDKYAKDLKLLKNVYKKYFPSEYNNMFKKIGNKNYVAYNGKNAGKSCKKCKPEDFFTMLKSQIKKLPDECSEKEYLEKQLNDNIFLRKINITDNGAIPHQLHKIELKKILENQSKYYKTISENKENIIKLFEFRIPYYVGPLSKENRKWSWVIRNSNESIRPWNFEEIVNIDATAEEFIKRMTNKCTYILNEDVIPKQSILYSKFCVLNELNNIRVNDNHIPRDMKQKIVESLFKKRKKVTVSMLRDFFKCNGFSIDTITGIPDGNNFNSNMEAYIDMEKIFGRVDETNIEKIEKIIYWITIFEDKKILKRKIQKEYPNITNEQLNNLGVRIDIWTHFMRECIINYVH